MNSIMHGGVKNERKAYTLGDHATGFGTGDRHWAGIWYVARVWMG